MDPVTLENALEKKCRNHAWLLWMLFLTSSLVFFNSVHLTSYVFLGGNPSFFCNIPELVEANWTNEQIREISSPGLETQNCVYYSWNYTLLKNLGFAKALRYSNVTKKPEVIKCKNYIYDEESVHQTIVSEWDLVCDDLPLRSTVQGSVAFGKFFGAVFFGLISDRFGRKKTFIVSCILYMISGPTAAYANSYVMFILLRLLIGLAGSGVYDTGYTLLLELTVKNYRVFVGSTFYIVFSFGLVYLALAGYLTNNWRQLQLAISLPMFLLIIHCWFIPESPRWLITSGKLKKAKHFIGSEAFVNSNDHDQSPGPDVENRYHSKCNVLLFFKDYLKLFSTTELVKRTVIFYFIWFQGNFYYYLIALNGSNFDINQYLYIGLNGIVEMPGTLLPIFFVTYFGRKSSAIALWIISGITMLIIILIPQGWAVMCVSFAGRLTSSAAFGITMFHTLELFPTENRNTAMGSCFTMAQLGPLLAPYVVDILGKKAWWIPSTLCGSLALIGAFLLIFVPETKNTPMLDTISEMKHVEGKTHQRAN